MTQKIRITKEFKFEMAHNLPSHHGACKNIHGHSYTLGVTIIGEPVNDLAKSDNGMIMDFGQLKKLVKDSIISVFDHALVMHQNTSENLLAELKANFEKILTVNYDPTSEHLIVDFVNRIQPQLPENVKLHSLKLRETATSIAEWFAEDNQ
ncbi:MAG: 6-carboxytetrahydropterin synthase [Bacteroidetes bacterium]|nr:6-carboxytetrahydropterin synthase [Bacteroidota bacterium]